MLPLLPHNTAYSLHLLFTFILTTQVNNLYYDFSSTIKNIPESFRLHFLKIADINVFLLFFIENLLSQFSEIEGNLGSKYSSLTF